KRCFKCVVHGDEILTISNMVPEHYFAMRIHHLIHNLISLHATFLSLVIKVEFGTIAIPKRIAEFWKLRAALVGEFLLSLIHPMPGSIPLRPYFRSIQE